MAIPVAGQTSAVLWDLGGVLLHTDWVDAAGRWEPRFGLPRGGLLRALFSENDDTVLVGRVSEEEWWEVVRQRLETSTAEIHELRSDLQRREHVDEELLQFVREVGDGVKQALVSNAWPGMRARLSARGLDGLFDEIVISAEVGAAKPMPKIFAIAVERLAVPPSRCIFVDDAIENVEAAAALGIVGYLHRRSQLTADWLRARLQRRPVRADQPRVEGFGGD